MNAAVGKEMMFFRRLLKQPVCAMHMLGGTGSKLSRRSPFCPSFRLAGTAAKLPYGSTSRCLSSCSRFCVSSKEEGAAKRKGAVSEDLSMKFIDFMNSSESKGYEESKHREGILSGLNGDRKGFIEFLESINPDIGYEIGAALFTFSGNLHKAGQPREVGFTFLMLGSSAVKKCAAMGSVEAQKLFIDLCFYQIYKSEKNWAEIQKDALKYLEEGLKAKNVEFAEILGSCYRHGWLGVDINSERSVEIFTELAEGRMNASPSLTAQSILAEMHIEGEGHLMEKSASERREVASAYGKNLAEADEPVGEHILGEIYRRGLGKEPELRKAFDHFTKAAEAGHPVSQYNLAALYFSGKCPDVPVDLLKAAELYELSAKQGMTNAQVNLGKMYANGYGVAKDITKAKFWLSQAAGTNQDAHLSLKELEEMEEADKKGQA